MRVEGVDQLVHQATASRPYDRVIVSVAAEAAARRRGAGSTPARGPGRRPGRAGSSPGSRRPARPGSPAWICIRPAPARIAPNSSAGEAGSRSGCERPSRATAIASKPTVVAERGRHRVGDAEELHVPARPASRPHMRHRQDDEPAAGASRRSGRRRGSRRPSGSRNRASCGRAATQTTMAIASAIRMPRWPFRPRRIGNAALPTSMGDRRGRARHPERAVDGPGQDRDGDVVEHDRGDDLVGARHRLEEARDEAPRAAGDASRPRPRAGSRRSAAGRAAATPTATAPSAPIRNWPWAPMLNRPALKPRPTDSPARTSGAVSTSVLTMALEAADRPLDQGAIGGERQRPGRTRDPAAGSSDPRMTTAPTTRPSRIETSGRPAITPDARGQARGAGATVRRARSCAGTGDVGRLGRSAARGRRSPSAGRPRSCRPSGRRPSRRARRGT